MRTISSLFKNPFLRYSSAFFCPPKGLLKSYSFWLLHTIKDSGNISSSSPSWTLLSNSWLQGELQHHQQHWGDRLQCHILHLGHQRGSKGMWPRLYFLSFEQIQGLGEGKGVWPTWWLVCNKFVYAPTLGKTFWLFLKRVCMCNWESFATALGFLAEVAAWETSTDRRKHGGSVAEQMRCEGAEPGLAPSVVSRGGRGQLQGSWGSSHGLAFHQRGSSCGMHCLNHRSQHPVTYF